MSFGKMFLSFFILATFCRCVSNEGFSTLATSNLNVKHLSLLSLGMTQREVLQIMNKPYNYESFAIGADIFDVWFYVATPTLLGQSRMVPQNLTPLAFKNGSLIGWGYRFYNHFIQKSAKEPKKPETQDEQPVAMSSRKSKTPPPEPEEDEEEPTPDEEGREMLQDDAEDDFNTW